METQSETPLTYRPDPEARIRKVLRREMPDRFVYAPNYWQWFTHHRRHESLPVELRDCRSQLDMIRHLGQDVFSRNVYCDPLQYWFGGLLRPDFGPVAYVEETAESAGGDRLTVKRYETSHGPLSEELLYKHDHSTLVQKKYLIDAKEPKLDAFAELVRSTNRRLDHAFLASYLNELRSEEVLVAGEVFSPLKLFHLAANPSETIFILMDHPKQCEEIMRQHTESQLASIRALLAGGVEVVMAMDNLDAAFHTRKYIAQCSADFYRRAGELCHACGAAFFIHACGQQKAILEPVAALGVDGLEGVCFPPLGDIALDEAMRLAPNLLITGGFSAHQSTQFTCFRDAEDYVRDLFERMRPYADRFMLSASCNVPIETNWDSIRWADDAWRKFATL